MKFVGYDATIETKQALGLVKGAATWRQANSTGKHQPMAHLETLIEEGQITDRNSPRGRLLDCAARLFRQKGYERTTVRDIASAVGIQSGSIFHHFRSKEDILRAVMSEALVYFIEELRSAINAAEGPEKKLLACIRSELQFTVGDDTDAVMSVLITEWRCLSQPHQQDILEYRDAYEQLWMDVLQRASNAGLVAGDIFIVRRLLAGAIHWTTTWFQPDGEMSLDDLALETLHLACSAHGKS